MKRTILSETILQLLRQTRSFLLVHDLGNMNRLKPDSFLIRASSDISDDTLLRDKMLRVERSV